MVSGTLGTTPIAGGRLNGEQISFKVGDTQYTRAKSPAIAWKARRRPAARRRAGRRRRANRTWKLNIYESTISESADPYHARLRQHLERPLTLLGEQREHHVDPIHLHEHRQLPDDRLTDTDARAGLADDADAAEDAFRSSDPGGTPRPSCRCRTRGCRRRIRPRINTERPKSGRHEPRHQPRDGTHHREHGEPIDDFGQRRANRTARSRAAPLTDRNRRASRDRRAVAARRRADGRAPAARRCGCEVRRQSAARCGIVGGIICEHRVDVVVCGRHFNPPCSGATISSSLWRRWSTRASGARARRGPCRSGGSTLRGTPRSGVSHRTVTEPARSRRYNTG